MTWRWVNDFYRFHFWMKYIEYWHYFAHPQVENGWNNEFLCLSTKLVTTSTYTNKHNTRWCHLKCILGSSSTKHLSLRDKSLTWQLVSLLIGKKWMMFLIIPLKRRAVEYLASLLSDCWSRVMLCQAPHQILHKNIVPLQIDSRLGCDIWQYLDRV